MRRRHCKQEKHSNLLDIYGNYLYYLFLFDIEYLEYVFSYKQKDYILPYFKFLIQIKKVLKKNFNILHKHLVFSTNHSPILLEPTYSYGGQFFSKESFFKTILQDNNLDGNILFKNNVKNQIGKNFFLTQYNSEIFKNNFFKNEDYHSYFILKHELELYENNFFAIISHDFINTIYFLQILEFYKILIFLNLYYNR